MKLYKVFKPANNGDEMHVFHTTNFHLIIAHIKQVDRYTDEAWESLPQKDSYNDCDGMCAYRIKNPDTLEIGQRYTYTCDYLHEHWIVDVYDLVD